MDDSQVRDHSSSESMAVPVAVDATERALAEALLRASRDGDRELALVIVEELRARRLARESGGASRVIDLDVER